MIGNRTLADIEGWDLFEISPGRWQIQRDDDADLLPDDAAALAHVRKWAALGSPVHVYALAKHDAAES
jgi:hypothetical protein